MEGIWEANVEVEEEGEEQEGGIPGERVRGAGRLGRQTANRGYRGAAASARRGSYPFTHSPISGLNSSY